MWYWLKRPIYLLHRRNEGGATESKGRIRGKIGTTEMGFPNTKGDFESIQSHLARYAFAAELGKGKVVLDVACGSGYGSSYLFGKGARIVVGGDISAKAVECAQKVYRRQGMEFVLLDAIKVPFADNSFDAIVSMETIEHLGQYHDAPGEMIKWVK